MSKLSVSDKINDDEIDFLSLIQTVWDGKWKIASIVAVSILIVFSFNIVIPNTTFTATTEIKPITSSEFDKYSLFNSSLKIIEKNKVKDGKEDNKVFNIFEITQVSLLELFLEEIEEGTLIETAVDKFDLLNKDDFNSDSDYREAIEKFASEIEVISPIKDEKIKRKMINKGQKILLHHILKVEYDNKYKWKQMLSFVNNEANRKVKANIINRFAIIVSVQNQIKDFAIKDIDTKIDNVKKDYNRNTKDRLAFLAEQAAIARKLDIPKNTIASQRFNTQNAFVTNVKTDAPFYLRGYLAIEEEINQIKNRKNKNSFTSNLFNLEQQKRTLKQDRTVERAIDLFSKTPLNQTDFNATIVKVATTNFKENNKSHLYYALAIVLGGIIGLVYVLVANAFRNRRTHKVNS